MALNLSLTGLLYAVCCLILRGVLALDNIDPALVIAMPLALALWVTTVRYLIRGIGAANRGETGRRARAGSARGSSDVTGPCHSVSARATVSASSRPRRVRTIRPAA